MEIINTRDYTPQENFIALFERFNERFSDYNQNDLLRQIGRNWAPAQRLSLFELLHDCTSLDLNQKLTCKVYRNIRKHNLSIQQKGLVKDRSQFIALANVRFKINSNGQQKVRKTGQKNVHAWVVGKAFNGITGNSESCIAGDSFKGLTRRVLDGSLKWSQVHYNPYKNECFVDNSNEPVHTAEYGFVAGNGQIWVLR